MAHHVVYPEDFGDASHLVVYSEDIGDIAHLVIDPEDVGDIAHLVVYSEGVGDASHLVVYSEDIGDVNPDVDDVHLAVEGQVKLVVVSKHNFKTLLRYKVFKFLSKYKFSSSFVSNVYSK